jgi:hypothetical protein
MPSARSLALDQKKPVVSGIYYMYLPTLSMYYMYFYTYKVFQMKLLYSKLLD